MIAHPKGREKALERFGWTGRRAARSVSSRLRNRSVKSFSLEVMCVQLSFQTPPVPGRGIQRRQVVLALARHP